MKLTQKDKEFLEILKRLLESKDLSVELKPDKPSYMVLRGTYGERIHKAFRMTRQGVRWRFHRIMDQYISSFESLLFIERIFGTQLRDHAMRISRERYELRQSMQARTPPQGLPDGSSSRSSSGYDGGKSGHTEGVHDGRADSHQPSQGDQVDLRR